VSSLADYVAMTREGVVDMGERMQSCFVLLNTLSIRLLCVVDRQFDWRNYLSSYYANHVAIEDRKVIIITILLLESILMLLFLVCGVRHHAIQTHCCVELKAMLLVFKKIKN
jgi:hypothetical protein